MLSTSYFVPENKEDRESEYWSPSKKYRLVVSYYHTREGAWNYSEGSIYGTDGTLIARVQRNYSRFPFCWVEEHPKGDFLVCGHDYQGQTVIDLSTGSRRDALSDGAQKGVGFCWSTFNYVPEYSLLLVDGCVWAGPYEYRLFDFSDPMKGWPSLEVVERGQLGFIPSSSKPPSISNNTVTTYQTLDVYDYRERYEIETIEGVEWYGPIPEDPDEDERFTIVSSKVYALEGKRLTFQSEVVSGIEAAFREEQLKRRLVYDAWLAAFLESDPLYLAYQAELKKPGLNPLDHESRGSTYSGWCPGFEAIETRWCRRIISGQRGYTVDLEWAVKTGPVKLKVYYKDTEDTKIWSEHSPESIKAAFKYARSLAKGKKCLLF